MTEKENPRCNGVNGDSDACNCDSFLRVGRPSRDRFNESMELQDWVTATAIRITLNKLNTFGDEVYGDPKVLRYEAFDFKIELS